MLYYNADVAANTTLTTNNETVVATLSGVSMQRAGQRIRFHGAVNVLTGTATSQLVLRVREDSLGGTLVDELETDTLSAAVGGQEDHDIEVEHVPTGELSNKTYVLTCGQNGATADGTCQHASLEATVYP